MKACCSDDLEVELVSSFAEILDHVEALKGVFKGKQANVVNSTARTLSAYVKANSAKVGPAKKAKLILSIPKKDGFDGSRKDLKTAYQSLLKLSAEHTDEKEKNKFTSMANQIKKVVESKVPETLFAGTVETIDDIGKLLGGLNMGFLSSKEIQKVKKALGVVESYIAKREKRLENRKRTAEQMRAAAMRPKKKARFNQRGRGSFGGRGNRGRGRGRNYPLPRQPDFGYQPQQQNFYRAQPYQMAFGQQYGQNAQYQPQNANHAQYTQLQTTLG